jgi:hypothetical protein
MKYGFTPEQWQTIRAEVRALMIGIAKLRTTITYGDFVAQLQTVTFHPGAWAFHALLREICFEEDDAGRGMLCAVIVSKATGQPGQGFFKALARRGRDCQDLTACWRAELARVYTIWGAA